jgi:cation-transporting ATPase 13A1
MMLAVRGAKDHLSPDYEADLDGVFKPGILNSVVFLVSNVQQVTVFVVNLQGRPFMTGLTENKPLLWSLLATFILTFMFASESVPGLNKYFQLVPFPSEDFRDYILKLLAADVLLTFVVDRLLKLIFAPQILFASMKGTSMKDVYQLGKTIAIILFLMYMFLGNDETWEEMLLEEGRDGELAGDVLSDADVVPNVTPALGGFEEL